MSVAVKGERRTRARAQRQALFYDSAERRRLWIALGALLCVVVLVIFGALISMVGNVVLMQRDSKVSPFGIYIHDDGDVEAMGPTSPMLPASTEMLRRDAEKYIQLLFPVTIPADQEGIKQEVLMRTAGGSPAETWVNDWYKDRQRSPFYTYKTGYIAVQHIRCHADTGTHFTCWFDRTPIDQFAQQAGNSVPWTAHLDIVQTRNKYADERLLFANPNETYVTHFDASADEGS